MGKGPSSVTPVRGVLPALAARPPKKQRLVPGLRLKPGRDSSGAAGRHAVGPLPARERPEGWGAARPGGAARQGREP